MKLLQFPYSHFCEKARWALDYKRQPFETQNLLPVLHIAAARRHAPTTKLPILLHDDAVIQGSDRIIDWLDARIPENPLTPAAKADALLAREWETFAGDEIGVHLRRWSYGYLLDDRRCTLGVWCRGATPTQRALLTLGFPLLRAAMRKALAVTPQKAAASGDRLRRALDRVDGALAAGPWLAGEQFSRADLSVAALLSPLVAVGRSDDELAKAMPEAFVIWRAKEADRPCFEWVRTQYRERRHPTD
jgi:glutathione S-transferase